MINLFVASPTSCLADAVSGAVVTTSGRNFADPMRVNTEELNQLAHTVLKAVDHMADKLNRNGRSADPVGH